MIAEIVKYLKYLANAQGAHGLHSPFVYELYTQTIKPDKQYYVFEKLERLRAELSSSATEIDYTDFGAGGVTNKYRKRRIGEIVNSAAKPAKVARLLFRLSELWNPDQIVELGTSLGVSTMYLATANTNARVLTFEGCKNTANVAIQNFGKIGLEQIKVITGNIDETLAYPVSQLDKIDLAFMDANHRYKPTIDYFNTLYTKAHEGSMFILDDIHWSNEMDQAWETIKADERVSVTIDLFYIGLVFFKHGQAKQNFTLKFG